jgi:hypothetical protein
MSGELATFIAFQNAGNGEVTGKPLGPQLVTLYQLHAVEIRFDLSAAQQAYRNFGIRQWSGPEAAWKKVGPLLREGGWELMLRGPGTGDDSPASEAVKLNGNRIAMYDSPGPLMTPYVGKRIARLYIVQNFTTWVVGTSRKTGIEERISLVTGWHSVTDLASPDWEQQSLKWERMNKNASGIGWVDTNQPPPVY